MTPREYIMTLYLSQAIQARDSALEEMEHAEQNKDNALRRIATKQIVYWQQQVLARAKELKEIKGQRQS